MYPIKKVVVCLDLTKMDNKLIEYTRFLDSSIGFEKITFIHVMQAYDLPEELLKELPDLEEPLEDILKRDIEEKMESILDPEIREKSSIIMGEGDTAQTIAEHIFYHKPDIILVGKKTLSKGSGIASSRLLKLSRASVMFVPEKARHSIKNILVAVDFSKSSQKAFRHALRIADKTDSNMKCVYVYNLPLSYFPHKPHDKFEVSMQKHGEKEFKKFLSKIDKQDLDCDCKFLLDEEGKPVRIIYKEAKTQDAGLIVIGAGGTSNAATTLVGSIPEKVTSFENDIPVLVVKDKREAPGFLKSIFEGRER